MERPKYNENKMHAPHWHYNNRLEREKKHQYRRKPHGPKLPLEHSCEYANF